jgi:hypothetical protein
MKYAVETDFGAMMYILRFFEMRFRYSKINKDSMVFS